MNAAESFDNVASMTNRPAASVVTVDPATAQRWLDRMGANRHVRPSRVEQYARDMTNGDWRLTGEPVKFAADGRLLDGQHRLKALIRAGVTLHMFVVRGLDDESQMFMDTGAARGPGDALGLTGETQSSALAAASRVGYQIEANVSGRDVSHALIYQWLAANPGIRDAVRRTGWKDLRSIKLTPAVLGYCYYRTMIVDREDAERFFVGVSTHIDCPANSPILALSDRLGRIREQRMRIAQRDLVHIVFQAFNAWRDGRSVKQIKLPRDDTPLQFPR